MVEKLPFQENFADGFYTRIFSSETIHEDLKWHWDEENRVIICEHDTDWLFQYDNQIPFKIERNKQFYIKEGEYHRLIKGTGDLTLKIKKLV